MAIDDHPIEALKWEFELENSSSSPVAKLVLDLLSHFPLMWPFDTAVVKLTDRLATDSIDRIRIMLEVCTEELLKHENEISEIKKAISTEELQQRTRTAQELLLDAARKAANTRAIERVKHIGLIVAKGTTERRPADADEIEEMMRVAMELNDNDIMHQQELVRVEGQMIQKRGRIERYAAYNMWQQCSWGTRIESILDSVFSKLTSYGLTAQVAPPNNLNISADFQNRYVLLSKGLRFVQLIQQTARSSA